MFPFQDNWFFKLTAKKLKAGEVLRLSKKHSFRLINTRVYYPGKHAVGIQVNRQILAKMEFEVRGWFITSGHKLVDASFIHWLKDEKH